MSSRNPLFHAIYRGNAEKIRVLLTDPLIDVNALNDHDWTPLQLVAYYNFTDAIKLFLADSRTDVNAQTKCAETALHLATYYGHTDIVKLLLADPRVDPTIRNDAAERALDIHLDNNEPDPDVVDLFLKHGAYTQADLDDVKEKFPELWERHQGRFRETFEALDQGPLAGQTSILSSLVAEALYPGVNFLNM